MISSLKNFNETESLLKITPIINIINFLKRGQVDFEWSNYSFLVYNIIIVITIRRSSSEVK